MYTTPITADNLDLVQPKLGNSIQGDEWHMSKTLVAGRWAPELMVVRCPLDLYDCPVEVKVTGRTIQNIPGYKTTFKKVRVSLTFINQDDNGNDVPSTFGGWMWINN